MLTQKKEREPYKTIVNNTFLSSLCLQSTKMMANLQKLAAATELVAKFPRAQGLQQGP
jgi:hypothetical protein